MIRKLKLKFIILAMSALFALLTIIVTGMNLINYNRIVEESDEILSILSHNRGMFPDMGPGPEKKLPPGFSPETPYESRYFSIWIAPDGQINDINIQQIASIDQETAIEYAEKVLATSSDQGFVEEYRYAVTEEFNGMRISFLDCGRRIDSFKSFLYASIGMSLAGYLVVFVIIFILSGKILQPIIESYEKQKQFITDAGHELKTPLTIINANVDLLEMDLGTDNESLQDIQLQTRRLRSLTDDLVLLARMEEAETTISKIDFPLSEVVAEIAHTFEALAIREEKIFEYTIQPMISFCGNYKAITQLVTILLDNALKYSPADSKVSLVLSQQNHSITLSVTNDMTAEMNSEQLKHVFDRFYRTDNSRNSETGGHGIGLSIAKAIVIAHGGEINAYTKYGKNFQITAVFPT